MPVARALAVAHPWRKPVVGSPANLGLSFEDVVIETKTGNKLRAWYIPSKNRAAIILTHGHTSNRGDQLDQAAELARHGYGVLMLDLQAHGESDGDQLALDGREVIAGAGYVARRADVDAGRIAAWGFSLGGLVSIQAAAQSDSIQAVVADGPFPVVADSDMPPPARIDEWLWIPFDWVQRRALGWLGTAPAMPTMVALSRIAPRPLLLVAGIQNRGERRVLRKYAGAPGSAVTLWEVPEAGHTGTWGVRKEAYVHKVFALFDRVLLGTTATTN